MPWPGQNQGPQSQAQGEGFKQKLLKVASIFSKKENPSQTFISVDDYNGELYFKEKETGQFYKVKALGVYEPKLSKNAKSPLPQNLCFNILINLSNPKAVEKLQG